jgi:hemerythrin superfamily protein
MATDTVEAEAPTKTRRAPAKRSTSSSSSRGTGTAKRATASKSKSAGALDGKGVVIGAAAAGLAVGLAANVARKFAVQSPTLLSGDWDAALANEHALTLKVFDAIESTTEKNTTKRATLLMNLKHMLAKHDMQEANVIYPALREAGETDAADHLNTDHGYVKQYLFELTEMPKDSPLWIAKVRKFRADIEKHMQEEETQLFPSLKGKLSAERNKQLTKEMNKEGLKLA